ncbi:hypothetical protein LHL03_08810 [Pectobacterium carotovorum]|uniref:hypothetical protein n=1 Tax=Pectobacterium TaxID=122277 RepID=UPI001CF9CDC3|nr:hypothetical protein [Pectobacterium carotovorum]UCZ81209.1 hypothetical protein LHL03_08810 [Pectobacterium carotovorum]
MITHNENDIESIIKNPLFFRKLGIKDKEGKTPIFHCKDKSSLQEMLRLGENINHQDNKGKTILFYYQKADVIKEILESNINFSLRDNQGCNFLSDSLFSYYPDIIMKYKNKFNFNNVILSKAFTNGSYLCNTLIENDFNIAIADDVTLGYPPDGNKTELKNLVDIMLKITDIDNKKIKFYFTPYYSQPIRKFFTLRNLYNISNKG